MLTPRPDPPDTIHHQQQEDTMNHTRIVAVIAAFCLPTAPIIIAQEKTMITSTGMELVWIPPGEFMMGSTAKEKEWAVASRVARSVANYEGGEPRRTVIRQEFWLGRTEVTVGQWKRFVAATGYTSDTETAGEACVPEGSGSIHWVTTGLPKKEQAGRIPTLAFHSKINTRCLALLPATPSLFAHG